MAYLYIFPTIIFLIGIYLLTKKEDVGTYLFRFRLHHKNWSKEYLLFKIKKTAIVLIVLSIINLITIYLLRF